MHDPSVVVDQVSVRIVLGRKERVSVIRQLLVVNEQPHGLLSLRGREDGGRVGSGGAVVVGHSQPDGECAGGRRGEVGRRAGGVVVLAVVVQVPLV